MTRTISLRVPMGPERSNAKNIYARLRARQVATTVIKIGMLDRGVSVHPLQGVVSPSTVT